MLGLAGDAEVLEPAGLRAELAGRLAALDALLAAPAPAHGAKPPAARRKPSRRRAADDLRVEVDRFTRLTALASYLMQRCRDEVVLDVATVKADLGVTARELRDDVGLLNLVNFGGDGLLMYAEFSGRGKLEVVCEVAGPELKRPARLSPLQADTLLLAIELVGHHLPTATGAALRSAAKKIEEARGGGGTLVAGDQLVPADAVLRDVNRAIDEHRLLRIEYWNEGTDKTSERVVEPYLLVHSRSEWYYVCWCRTAGGTRVFRVATTKSAELLDGDVRAPGRTSSSTCTAARASRRPGATRRGRRPCGTAPPSPAGSPSASRSRCCRTAPAWRASPTWTSAGSPPTCCRWPTRRARSTRRRRWTACAPS